MTDRHPDPLRPGPPREGRLADRAYAGIVDLIEAEVLATGDRLPSETRLAELFAMSRTIVREALVRLAADGLIEARRGAGSFVKRLPSTRLSVHMASESLAATLGTYEVRFVLEAEAARLAAMRRSDDQMVAIKTALERLRAALGSAGPAHQEDIDLHRAIMLATANPAFLSSFDHLLADIERVMRAGIDISRARPSEAIAAMMDEHEVIVDAIRDGDGEAAALAMRWHLSQGRKRLLPLMER